MWGILLRAVPFRVLSVIGGAGLIAVILCVMTLVAYLMLEPPAAAHAEHEATQCILRAAGERLPVTYLAESRNNPDGTFYPGDAFYYVFWWSDRSEPGECGMRPPVLETQGVWVNHTAYIRGPLNPATGEAPVAVHSQSPQHVSSDPVVRLVESVHFFASRTADDATCKTTFSKPGESWSIRWEKHTIYDKSFLTKQKTDGATITTTTLKLSDFELSKASRSPGKPMWEVWREVGEGSGRELPDCPFVRGPSEIRADANATAAAAKTAPPFALTAYGQKGIFHTTSYEWRLIRDAGAAHNHTTREVLADDGTRRAFEDRVADVCLDLPPDAGCLYGTAYVKPYRVDVCLYAEIERILGEKWLANQDKDADGVHDSKETAEGDAGWPPPPPLSAARHSRRPIRGARAGCLCVRRRKRR